MTSSFIVLSVHLFIHCRFYWSHDHNKNFLPGTATIYWEIPDDQDTSGTYRLFHKGYYKERLVPVGSLEEYETFSSDFEILDKNYQRS